MIAPILLFLGMFIGALQSQPANRIEDFGILDVKHHQVAELPRAVGDGVTDDTDALQVLINYAHRNRMAVVFPSGTYLVSRTLNMMDDNPHHASDEYSFVLLGSTQGSKPVIRLQDQAAGFDDENDPQPILKFFRLCGADPREDVSTCREPNNTVNGEGHPGNYFSDGVRNLEIAVGLGNPGAVGIYFAAAQDSFIEDVKIDMTQSGYAGFTAIPGPASVIGNITVLGGSFGIKGNYIYNPTINNVKLIGQSVAAIETGAFPVLTLVGFEIQKEKAPAVRIVGHGGIVMVDGKIDITQSSNDPVVALNNSKSTSSLINVYLRNANQAIDIDGEIVEGGSGWYHLQELYGKSEINSIAIIDQQQSEDTYHTPLMQTTQVPDDLGLFHTWPNYYSPDHLLALSQYRSSGICNALDPNDEFEILGNRVHNDAPGLQAMIDAERCGTIFLPKGDYFIGETLTLGAQTKLLGLAHSLTILAPTTQSDNAGALVEWQPTEEVDFITTVDDADATTMLADVRLKIPTAPREYNWLTALHWKAGRQSILKNVFTNSTWSREAQTNPKAEVRFTGNGGGKWFGAGAKGLPPTDFPASPGYRKLVISGTSEPLALYNLNIEDGYACPPGLSLTCPDSAWQAEIINSANVAIFGAKYENQKGLLIQNSNNIGYFGTNVGTELGAYDNKNIIMASLSSELNQFGQEWVLKVREQSYANVIDKDAHLLVYKQGDFDISPFRITEQPALYPLSPLWPWSRLNALFPYRYSSP